MEAALQKLEADLLLLDDDSGQTLLHFDSGALSDIDLQVAGSKFLSLNKLAQTLKMGPLHQIVIEKESGIELDTCHEKSVAVVASKRLDKAIVADSLVDQLFQE